METVITLISCSQPSCTWDIAFYTMQPNRDELSMRTTRNEPVCLLNATETAPDVDVLTPALINATSITVYRTAKLLILS